ncbi:MAG: transcription antitermination factor NusB [Fimbriiglobus sp.]
MARLFRRSRGREVALQLLFQADQNIAPPVRRKAVEKFARDRLTDRDLVAFALGLFDGVEKTKPDVDKLITATADNWRLNRMNPVDRNVLRLGTFELLHDPDQAPVPVLLNEAIELARRFGTADSPGFVNGILDRIARSRKEQAKPQDPRPPG